MPTDREWMLHAIHLGEKGRITAPPNPWVGCVIVQNDHAVGEGYHVCPGEPHAEVHALEQAGEKAKGATVYLTLEPCVHYGRTPPCTNALIEAGVKRVVIGVEDPDSQVRGKGVQQLRNAGIEVMVGISTDDVYESLEPYLHQRKTGRPFCIAKAAVSIDGRTAAADHSSQWISSPEAREDVHLLRAESQAILIGAGTALKDKPQLTVRHLEPLPQKQPLRVLLDTHGRVACTSPLFDTSLAPTLIFTSNDCNSKVRQSWEDAGAEVLEVEKDEKGLDLEKVLAHLYQRGVVQLLIEGGAALFGSILQKKFMDRLIVYIGACILGDRGQPLFRNIGIESMENSIPMEFIRAAPFGTTVKLEYRTTKEA